MSRTVTSVNLDRTRHLGRKLAKLHYRGVRSDKSGESSQVLPHDNVMGEFIERGQHARAGRDEDQILGTSADEYVPRPPLDPAALHMSGAQGAKCCPDPALGLAGLQNDVSPETLGIPSSDLIPLSTPIQRPI